MSLEKIYGKYFRKRQLLKALNIEDITEHLDLSDKQIENFKNRLNDFKRRNNLKQININ